MKKIILALIVVFLASLVVIEEILVEKSMNQMYSHAVELQTMVADNQNINTPEILSKVENMEILWLDYEKNLCFFVNHKDIEDIGVELSRMKANVAVNQFEDFKASLSLIVFYSKIYSHIMGVSFQNII